MNYITKEKKRRRKRYIGVFTDGKYVRKEIKKRSNKSMWILLKDFINSEVENNQAFTRLEMLEYIYPKFGEYLLAYDNSVDIYRSLLMNKNIKILEPTTKRGVYIKRRNIPDKLTTTQLTKIAHDGSWKSWFSGDDIEEKMEVY